VLIFYHKAISQYFSHRYGKHKSKNVNSGGVAQGGGANDDLNKDKEPVKLVGSGIEMRRGSGAE